MNGFDIMQAISTVEFPIVAFLIAAYGLKYAYDKSFETIADLTKAVNDNTQTLTKLVEKMEDLKHED